MYTGFIHILVKSSPCIYCIIVKGMQSALKRYSRTHFELHRLKCLREHLTPLAHTLSIRIVTQCFDGVYICITCRCMYIIIYVYICTYVWTFYISDACVRMIFKSFILLLSLYFVTSRIHQNRMHIDLKLKL